MDGEGLSPPRQAVMGTGGQVPRGPARLLLLAILAAACASCGGPHPPAGVGDAEDALALPPATLTARDLASRLVDLERLAVLPDNGEQRRQPREGRLQHQPQLPLRPRVGSLP